MFQTSRHVLIQYRYNGSSTVSSEGSCRRRCRGDERADITRRLSERFLSLLPALRASNSHRGYYE